MSSRGKYRMFVCGLICFGVVILVLYTRDNVLKRLPEEIEVMPKSVSGTNVSSDKFLVYPCGFPIGVYLETDGVMVIGTSILEGDDGLNYEPSLSKVKAGDYIVKVNNIDVSSKSQLSFLVNRYGDEDIVLTVKRNGELIEVKLKPIEVAKNEYKLGIWVRDDSQGIGTMTFVTNRGDFGALGHGISDVDTGELLNAAGGTLYGADIWGIKKGESGKPGGLYGVINYENENIMGEIKNNTDKGIFGKIAVSDIVDKFSLEPLEIKKRNEIKEGKATIRTTVSGQTDDYEILIEKIDIDCDTNKSMVIRITDKELLKLTGGIVQGMFTSYNGSNNRKASKIKGFLMF